MYIFTWMRDYSSLLFIFNILRKKLVHEIIVVHVYIQIFFSRDCECVFVPPNIFSFG
jgi:hypothetical protein